MRKIILPAILVIVFFSCNETKKEGNASEVKQDSSQVAAVYQCPMDCENGKTYDKQGVCPVCGMDLEKKS
jgi:hypothetical protein